MRKTMLVMATVVALAMSTMATASANEVGIDLLDGDLVVQPDLKDQTYAQGDVILTDIAAENVTGVDGNELVVTMGVIRKGATEQGVCADLFGDQCTELLELLDSNTITTNGETTVFAGEAFTIANDAVPGVWNLQFVLAERAPNGEFVTFVDRVQMSFMVRERVAPTTIDDCKDGGFANFGYTNPGLCARDVFATR